MRTPSGYILYDGPSVIDGAPITAIAITRNSTNRKTGAMVQTYIMRADGNPIAAARSGADSSVCGNCKHRPANGGACYVALFHGPMSVWRAYERGSYPTANQASFDRMKATGQHMPPVSDDIAALGAGRMVRLGTYGDPAAVPAWVWQALTRDAAGHTGYTHQWANPAVPAEQRKAINALCMASADDEREAGQARAIGLRTFRIRPDTAAPLLAREFVCPASEEAGKRKTCAECKACSGTTRSGQASPVIVVHGPRASKFINPRLV